ncbi:MAG: hypothetical protein IKY41_01455 [Clostridia bacterium]|nr:hypothetical protein [Clostridia bacterium]
MNRGNNAYQYDYNATQEEYIIPEEKIEEKRIILTELRRKKEDKKTKRNIIVGITILVMMGLTVAFRYASVTQINYENHKLEQEYQQKTAVVQNLQVDIESNMNIAEIAEIAETKLGMHKPFSYQIKYIDVETPDQTEYKNTEFTKEENNDDIPFVKRLFKDIKQFFGVI